MKDIFISYSSEDRAIAQQVAHGLEAAGLSVWWDRDIQVGSEWDKTIEEALAGAKCAVVLWTAHAKQSRWVRAEARAALKEQKIIPVMLEANAIPLAFTGIQALRFLDWKGTAESKEFALLLSVIKAKLAGQPIALPVEAATKASWVGKIASVIGIKILAAIVFVMLLLISSFWHIDADVSIQLQTGRLEAVINPGSDQKRLIDPLMFHKLSLHHVGRVTLGPNQLLVANPDELDWETDSYPPKAWIDLPHAGRAVELGLIKPGTDAMVSVESTDSTERSVGRLDAIVLTMPTTVTLETSSDQTMTMTLRAEQDKPRVIMSGLRTVEIVQEGLLLQGGANLPFNQNQELTYQALFDGHSGTITVEGSDTTFSMVINPSERSENFTFSTTTLPLESLDVSWQDPKTGERKSHPNFQGVVRYRNLTDFPEVTFRAPMFLSIEDFEGFEITAIRVNFATRTIGVDMQGKVGYIKTGTRDNPRDLRPTLFDIIRFHPVFSPLRNLIGL